MHLTFRNVNHAFLRLVHKFHESMSNVTSDFPAVKTESRAGKVIQVLEPVTVTYTHPQERVLFNVARDANPFFHLFESLWMLAGRNDVAPLAYYNSKIADIASDDGGTFNGAYGYRWRHVPGDDDKTPNGQEVDQLEVLIDQLKRKPESRRVVLQMWNVEDDLLKIDTTKDVCCNTHAYFMINRGRLDMTVCNRSNDMIWGMLGANVVHFSFLQEYIALALGISVGYYNQFTNNLHVYEANWEPQKWLESRHCGVYPMDLVSLFDPNDGQSRQTFDRECAAFVTNQDAAVSNRFLNKVASPMCLAFRHHKERDYVKAYEALRYVQSADWRSAAHSWIARRERAWVKDHPDANPYLARELERQAKEASADETGEQ